MEEKLLNKQNTQKKFIDLVVCGPDMSGTSTQIEDLIGYFQTMNLKVRDLRGGEASALFHAEIFEDVNTIKDSSSNEYFPILNVREFLDLSRIIPSLSMKKNYFFEKVTSLIEGFNSYNCLQLSSMIKNDISTYINPDSADIWIMEEPTRRGAGQTNRFIEQNRSKFNSELCPVSAATTHSVYRLSEFLRFRKALRSSGKFIIRSRSEESACYQVKGKEFPMGMELNDYLGLPGHNIAFLNPPTDIFVVHGPENWTETEWLKLKNERSAGRLLDDHEKNVSYQLMVNKRYASDWLERLYAKGIRYHNGSDSIPRIHRFNMYDSKRQLRNRDQLRNKMFKVLDDLIK